MTFTSMLGLPVTEENVARMMATGDAELDRKVVDWLGVHEGQRFLGRSESTFFGEPVLVCSLIDRGREHRTLSGKSWEDAVRNCLGIVLGEDYWELRLGIRLPAQESQALSLEAWLRAHEAGIKEWVR